MLSGRTLEVASFGCSDRSQSDAILVAVLLVNNDLVRAIGEKRIIEFTYKGGGARTAEPHDYGVLKGVESLVAFQITGESRSGGPLGWRQFTVADIQQLRVLEQRFPGSRADSAQHHREWDMLFARVT